MSAFTENDLRHSATLLHKLNNLKDSAVNVIEVDYAELVALRKEDKLKAGCYYRIVDYQTTTSQTYTTVANHSFDVIVLALDANVLSEHAYAVQRAEDTYFNNSTLEAWELKYCLDNDSDRFAWADPQGYGVVYYMKDEFGNEASYDFKNILIDGQYTFGTSEDYSMSGDIYRVYNNKIAPSHILPVSDDSVSLFAASAATSIVIGSDHSQTNLQCYDYLTIPCNTFTSHCYNITVDSDSYGNKFIGTGFIPCCNIVLGCSGLFNTIQQAKNIQIGQSCFNNYFSTSDSIVFGNSNMNFRIKNSNNIVVGNYNLCENIEFYPASGSYIGNNNELKASSSTSTLMEACHIGSFNKCTFGSYVQRGLSIGDNNQLTCNSTTTSLCIGNNNASCYIGTGSFLQCSIGDNTSKIQLNGELKFCRIESNCSNITVNSGSTAVNTVFKSAFNEFSKTYTLTDSIYQNNNLKEIY